MVGRDSVEPKRPVIIRGPLDWVSPYEKPGSTESRPTKKMAVWRPSLPGTMENARNPENISNAGAVPLSNQTG